jgi:hypothetical protein
LLLVRAQIGSGEAAVKEASHFFTKHVESIFDLPWDDYGGRLPGGLAIESVSFVCKIRGVDALDVEVTAQTFDA